VADPLGPAPTMMTSAVSTRADPTFPAPAVLSVLLMML
jgi:hypothetical protein